MRYGLEFAGERRRVRRTWGRTLLDVLMLLALAALCGWLWSCVKSAAHGSLFSVRGSLLAMAPVTQGMVFGLLLSLSVLGIVLAVRKVRENELWCEELRQRQVQRKRLALKTRREFWENGDWPHDVPSFTVGPLESLSEPLSAADVGIRAPKPKLRPVCVRGCQWECSCLDKELLWVPYENADEGIRAPLSEAEIRTVSLGLEDLRGIVNACREEGREVLLLIESAQRTMSIEDYGDSLVGAQRRQKQVVRTLGELLRSLQTTDTAQRVPTTEGTKGS